MKHGEARKGKCTPEYRAWRGMIARCMNKNRPDWPRYGGRGIKVCERWQKFETFLSDMGRRPNGTSLDRFPDNNGNYEPGNCRWGTPSEQARNKRNSVLITIDGITRPAPEWDDLHGLRRNTVVVRYWKGWRGTKLLLPVINRKIQYNSENPLPTWRLSEKGKRHHAEATRALWQKVKASGHKTLAQYHAAVWGRDINGRVPKPKKATA